MGYKISYNTIINYNEIKNHYIGWVITGNYYEGETLIRKNNIDDIGKYACNFGCIFKPIKNGLDFIDNYFLFYGSEECYILPSENKGIKLENGYLIIMDYGATEPVIQDIVDTYNNNVDSVLINNIPNILYRQDLNNKNYLINKIKINKIAIGNLKVKLKGMEN